VLKPKNGLVGLSWSIVQCFYHISWNYNGTTKGFVFDSCTAATWDLRPAVSSNLISLCPTAGEADLQLWRLTQTSLTDQTNDGGDNVDGSEE